MLNAYEKNVYVKVESREFQLKVQKENGKIVIFMGDRRILVDYEKINKYVYSFIIDGKPFEAEIEKENEGYRIYVGNVSKDVFVYDLKRFSITSRKEVAEKRGEHIIRAPMPGKIAKIFVKEGEPVKKSQPILTMEAMKMENEIRSPVDGKVKKIYVRSAEVVESKAELAIVIEE